MKRFHLQLKDKVRSLPVNKYIVLSFFIHILVFSFIYYSPSVTTTAMPETEISMIDLQAMWYNIDENVIIKKQNHDNGNDPERTVVPLGNSQASLYLPIYEVHKPPVIKIAPEYPEQARQTGIEGIVIVELDINEKGRIMAIRIVKSAGHGFDEAAVKSLKKLKCKPALKAGEPVPVRVKLPIKFELE